MIRRENWISDELDGTEIGSNAGEQQNDAEGAIQGKDDDRVPIDWFKDTSNATYSIGQLVFFGGGLRRVGSGQIVSHVRKDGRWIMYIRTCAHNFVAKKANGKMV